MEMRRFGWIIIFFTGLPVFAQQNFASISFGASIPLGEYASTGNLASSGYAKTGGAIKFDAGYFPGSYLGIGGSFSFGSNYAIRDSILQDMITYIEENASSIIDIPPGVAEYGSGFWNYINIFLGPHFSVRATQRLYLDVRVLAGISVLRPPDQELYIPLDDGTEIFTTVSNSKIALGFTAGGGLRFKLNENLALKLGADFTQSRAKFNYFELFQGVADVPPVHSEFFVRTLEASVGLAYAF